MHLFGEGIYLGRDLGVCLAYSHRGQVGRVRRGSPSAHLENGPREGRNTLKLNFRLVLALKWYIPP